MTSGTPINVTVGSTTTGINFALAQAPPQTNDEIPGATPVSLLPYSTGEDTRTATSNPPDPLHTCGSGTQDSNTVWFRYVASFTGTLRVSTSPSNYDTVLTAYPGTTSVGPQLACNDDANGTTQSEISFTVSSEQSYLIEVSTSSSLYRVISVSSFSSGRTPASVALSALSKIMNRIAFVSFWFLALP